ncbi:MAG: dihydroneopterin aldolase [Bacteroidota bacterium]
MSKILLENMEFFAYHGCFREEQIIGNQFVVNMEIETDTQKAQQSDKLSDALNYQEVYNTVREQVDIKSHLLEHVGRRILDAVMDKYKGITYVKLKISKMHPPIGGKMKCVSIELERGRK